MPYLYWYETACTTLGYTQWVLGGVVILLFFFYFFVPNGQVLLENVRTRFEPNCANLFRGQNGHFWSYLDPKWRFRAVRGSGTP